MKGFVIFYVNFDNFEDQEKIEKVVALARSLNKEFIENASKDGYQVVFQPTTDEATRVEMFNFTVGKMCESNALDKDKGEE